MDSTQQRAPSGFGKPEGAAVAMRQEAVVYYIHSDHLGSVSLVTDHVSEAVARQLYHPYGSPRWSQGTLPTDYTFTGQRDEAGLGLMHYGARFYSPRLGRFVSADSIVPSPLNPQDFNRYTYGRNNPLAYIDADGHFPVLVLVALGVTAASIAFFRTPACAGEGCAPGTSSSSPEYQVKSYATAAETAVEVYFGAKLLAVQLGAETLRDEDRDQKEAVEEVVEGAEEAIEQGAKEGTTYKDLLTPDEIAEFNRLKQQYPDWMPDLDSPAKVRTPAEVREARRKVQSRGHHRDPLAFGGDPNPEEGLVPTEETRTTKNPIHTTVSGFWNEVLRRIRSKRE
jgi:RHS repeat-associated protein